MKCVTQGGFIVKLWQETQILLSLDTVKLTICAISTPSAMLSLMAVDSFFQYRKKWNQFSPQLKIFTYWTAHTGAVDGLKGRSAHLSSPWTAVCFHHCQEWKQLSLCRGKVPATVKTENTLNISVLLSHLRETSRRGLWFKHCSCSKSRSSHICPCVVSTFIIQINPAFPATACFTLSLVQLFHPVCFLHTTPGYFQILFYLCRVSLFVIFITIYFAVKI